MAAPNIVWGLRLQWFDPVPALANVDWETARYVYTASSAARERQGHRRGTITTTDQMHNKPQSVLNKRCSQAIGNAVVSLIFSMANRDVTFLSGTAAIKRL
jgi:hypothetical protein